MNDASIQIGLSGAIVAVTNGQPRMLTVNRSEWGRAQDPALPFGTLDARTHRTLELGLRSFVRDQTGLELGYVEQLYTFGDRDRADRPRSDDDLKRVISVAYLALVREQDHPAIQGAQWRDCYRFLPWEDWREGRPAVLDSAVLPALESWTETAETGPERNRRKTRVEVAFGTGPRWDTERVLERYELLYEASLVLEAEPHRSGRDGGFGSRAMAVDHRRILATALGRLRGKLKYRPVVFELLPPEFTLLQLMQVVEALAGINLHKANFRRLVERGGLVEGTGRLNTETGGRPAEVFQFRREVVRERVAPGVGLPGAPLRS